MDDTRGRIEKLGRRPAESKVLGLPYYSVLYSEYVAFLRLEPMCSGNTVPDWMVLGCSLMKPEFSMVHRALQTTMPFTLRMYVGKMRSAGVREELLRPIENAISAARLDEAVVNYDTAVRASELGATHGD